MDSEMTMLQVSMIRGKGGVITSKDTSGCNYINHIPLMQIKQVLDIAQILTMIIHKTIVNRSHNVMLRGRKGCEQVIVRRSSKGGWGTYINQAQLKDGEPHVQISHDPL